MPPVPEDMESTIRRLLGETVKLPVAPAEIGREQPLYGEGGLASLEVLELVVALEERFNLQVPDEDIQRLNSIRAIVEYIQQQG